MHVKIIAFTFLIVLLVPLIAGADIIFFKDGMKTVCQDKAWEEDGEIKCEYSGTILIYQKKDVTRIEKATPKKEIVKPSVRNQNPIKSAAKPSVVRSQIKTTAPKKKPPKEKGLKPISKNNTAPDTKGLEFYNPRRPQKYWTDAASKHNSFEEAIAALAKQYERSPEWVQHHMGETNDLNEIHQNLANSKTNAPVEIQNDDDEKVPEILFYNPRRTKKYWTSKNKKHHTFKEAISALAKEYERSQEWIQQHMGDTNNLNEIHQNLANSKQSESSP